ncbi:GSCFA domain-containing protein [Lutibacter sp. TH_r2]|uniref:GSCFA domain-containing protein n=1 Tax=Lutibacter sp. TH_r2 TaxID=3082083 RepID=UPI002952F1CD|nr:GSCFA domain-containing protein [Lutibacter sp. TH_r2]MDV7186128.1 GSCFA domain-containing protein [Lutibacter sp. TH_r2]
MNFRTNIQLKPERNQIDYSSKLLLIGSCFSENISKKLDYFKFQAKSNPFGILYNPIAIENLITNAINEKQYSEKDIFQLNERWHCFDAHSDCSSTSKKGILSNLNTQITSTKKQLKNTSHLIITLGTARVYRHIESDIIVGNCHKIPQKKFLQELLSVKQIIASLENIVTLIKTENASINIIFTVSPIRHLKDGFIENMQSKSHLISAIQQLVDQRKQLYYFPSYEIMMDDLRDYRFYKSDMIHPNNVAINYIWEQFQNVWIYKKSLTLMKEVEAIQKGLAHKPFNPDSTKHKEFLEKLQLKIKKLKNEHNIII